MSYSVFYKPITESTRSRFVRSLITKMAEAEGSFEESFSEMV